MHTDNSGVGKDPADPAAQAPCRSGDKLKLAVDSCGLDILLTDGVSRMPAVRSANSFANNYMANVSSRLPGPADRSDTLLRRSVKGGD
jgi:hypothetical protein